MAKKTRDDRVLEFLKSHDTINFFEALYECGTSRLAASIWNLRHKRNLNIEKEMVAHTNQFGDTERVAYYRLIN